MEEIIITITLRADQSVSVEHLPTLFAETVVSALERAANYYKMRMIATTVVEMLRKAKEEEKQLNKMMLGR